MTAEKVDNQAAIQNETFIWLFNQRGYPQHVIIRGNNRKPVFYADEDYQFYLKKLLKDCNKHNCDVHAYALMINHVHLLITPYKKDGISNVILRLGRYYVQYFNHTYQRTETLW